MELKADTWSSKVVTRDGLLEIIANWRAKNETIAFTNGVFDLLHRGHLFSIETASETADRLVVGINSDNSVRLWGKESGRPIIDEEDRTACIAALGAVDLVVLFDEPTPYELLSALKPDVLVKGNDYKIEDVIGREFAVRVELIERLVGFSTTNIIEKISKLKF
ncbi:MAG: adenylyltransferase/cytidyltransferase family protein [Candidatus Hatepunaea meridiana]|nr:adenylyltransferase/cytidyltransferase family protein [Candidatus Hatepunaea meridiana]